MTYISKFIAKEWFKALFGALIVLFLLVSVGDIINGFLRNYEPKRIIIEYLLKLPELASKMFPISALLASLFAVNKLKTHSELMAILAGGFSAPRIYKLILLCSFSLATVQFINLGFVIPQANEIKRAEFEKSRKNESKYLARSTIGDTGLIWYKTDEYFTSFKAFDSKNETLKEITIYFLSENKILDSIYKARSAKYIKDNRWSMQDIEVTQSLDVVVSQTSEMGIVPTQGFPKSTTAKNLIIKLKEVPSDFGQFESDITTLNIFELGRFIERLQETDINSVEYEIIYYEKISLAIICVIFSLFPLSGIFSPNRRASGFGKSVVITLIFTIFFWAIHSGSIAMGNSGKIPILLATMGIPVVFSIYIAIKFIINKRL